MPQYILLRIEKETNKVIDGTYSYSPSENTMITREHESENHYFKTFQCDYTMRHYTVNISDVPPKYILLLFNKKSFNKQELNYSLVSFGCSLEEVKNICQEYNCDFYGVQVIPCDPSLRL